MQPIRKVVSVANNPSPPLTEQANFPERLRGMTERIKAPRGAEATVPIDEVKALLIQARDALDSSTFPQRISQLRPLIEVALTAWVEEGGRGEERATAADRIRSALETGRSSLHLEKLSLRTLPFEIISLMTKLTFLDLNNNQLTSVDGLGTLTGLTDLYLNNNRLTSVEGLGPLTGLTSLNLNNNRLTSVEGLGPLTGLTNLFLNNNQLISVTELGTLTELTILNLNNNRLTSVEELGRLTRLTFLDLSGNQLTSVGGLRTLTGLTTLHLFNNQLTEFEPNWFPNANIEALGNRFSQAFVARHRGDLRFRLSVYDPFSQGRALEHYSFETMVNSLFCEATKHSVPFPPELKDALLEKESAVPNFGLFLTRLPMMADWGIATQMPVLLRQLVRIVKGFNESPLFEARCDAIAMDSLVNCGDNVAVSFLEMAVSLQPYVESPKDFLAWQSLARFHHLQSQAKTHGGSDKVEDFMFLLVRLNESLALQLPLTDMRYPLCARVTKDLAQKIGTDTLALSEKLTFTYMAAMSDEFLPDTLREQLAVDNGDLDDAIDPRDNENSSAYEQRLAPLLQARQDLRAMVIEDWFKKKQ